MQLPDSVKAIRARYVAKFPVPQGAPGEAIEEQVRQWSIGLAEQVAYELPNQGWGTKRADPNRPISKDGLAWREDEDRGGRLWIFDMVTGAGTGNGRLVDNPEAEDITGQVFVAVTPKDHLGVKPTVNPLDVLPPADLGPVMSNLSILASKLDTLQQSVDAVTKTLAIWSDLFNTSATVAEGRHQIVLAALKHLDEKPFPAYVGALSGRMRFTPESPK